MENNICFIDFESTGINVLRDAPIEFGAVLVDENLHIMKQFHSRINFDSNIVISESAFAIHGLRHDDLKNEPQPDEMLNSFFKQFGTDYRFAGWNIGFDVTFFRRLCNENNLMNKYNLINHRHIDIQTLNYLANEIKVFPKNLKSLSDLASYFQLNRSDNHSALEDALLTFEVYKKLMKIFKEKIHFNS